MTNSNNGLMRFLEAQNKMYLNAFSEIEKEKKKHIGCGLSFLN